MELQLSLVLLSLFPLVMLAGFPRSMRGRGAGEDVAQEIRTLAEDVNNFSKTLMVAQGHYHKELRSTNKILSVLAQSAQDDFYPAFLHLTTVLIVVYIIGTVLAVSVILLSCFAMIFAPENQIRATSKSSEGDGGKARKRSSFQDRIRKNFKKKTRKEYKELDESDDEIRAGKQRPPVTNQSDSSLSHSPPHVTSRSLTPSPDLDGSDSPKTFHIPEAVYHERHRPPAPFNFRVPPSENDYNNYSSRSQ